MSSIETIANSIDLQINHAAKDKLVNKRWERFQYPDESNTCYVTGRKAHTRWIAVDMWTDKAVPCSEAEGNDSRFAFFPICTKACKQLGIPSSHYVLCRDLWA